MVKILWDLNIERNHVIQDRRTDKVVLHKTERNYHIIDIVVPGDKL